MNRRSFFAALPAALFGMSAAAASAVGEKATEVIVISGGVDAATAELIDRKIAEARAEQYAHITRHLQGISMQSQQYAA
jgi:membrane-bound ClpP family serine protease